MEYLLERRFHYMKMRRAFNEKTFMMHKMLFLWHKQRLFSFLQTFYAVLS